ncbi:(2Fe-2S)-binding protein [Robbsia andropogonis]|uniref:Bacterioferritin-associated ferredoxin n=1 Tax=Robbsia andropogonis TaxID=28092 RepID=A0A0F5K0C5_9BURK|nr:(2Fe-2S)-binding protein [Robbsia andropogonis]KKB63523.1 (2Fe-2S)-binding protein [Robbsia andropogonis]MCP1116834.1 (2Fe-2S)-binding protein [Robbsia andropogonis]MCP1126487.1 (2Fe-2S)-binding protein [Robbsia andropogonis]
MIVCVCKAISDRQLRASIEAGNNSFDALQFEHGVATCCGRCEEAVHDVLEGREIGCSRRSAAANSSAAPVVFYATIAA